MSFLGQNTYLERDRYYQAVVAIPAGKSGGELSKIFKDNNIWWWEIASGELDAYPGFEWHFAYMKVTSQNVRPSGIAKVLAPAAVLVDSKTVTTTVASLLSVMELWSAWGMGFDPSEGATLAAQDTLQPNAYYTTAIEWPSAAAVLSQDDIVARIKSLNIAIFDVDKCLTTIPMPFAEGQGNLVADTVKYYADRPTFATCFLVASDTNQTVRKIRDALGAKNIYIIRKPFLGSVETKLIVKLCAAETAIQNVAFAASRFVSEANDKVGKILDPKVMPWVLGISAGLGLVWLGYKVFGYKKKEVRA